MADRVIVRRETQVRTITINRGPPGGGGGDILPIDISDVTGLQTALDGRATDAELTAEAATRAAADTTLQTNIDGKQALHANLTALAGLVGASDRAAYFTGAGALSLYTLTAFGRTLAALADAAAGRTALSVPSVAELEAVEDASIAADLALASDIGAIEADIADGVPPSGAAGGQLGGTYPNPDVRGLRTTTGPTLLTLGAVADGEFLKRDGSTIVGAAAGGGGGADFVDTPRSSNTILGTADKGKAIRATAAYTQTLDDAATLGADWWVLIQNATTDGTSLLVVEPDGAELIDGLTNLTLYSGEQRLVMCTGTAFRTRLLQGGFARFTADGNFIVPPGIRSARVVCVGAGGGGGGARGAAAGGVRQGGSGGGGGACVERELPASLLGAAGSSVTVTVPAGGAAGAGGSSDNGGAGTTGSSTTFGSLVTGYGGGGGGGGTTGTTKNGGAGGGDGEAGTLGGTGATRGGANSAVDVGGMGGAGGSGSVEKSAQYGGAGGGQCASAGGAGLIGGTSVWGGGGGGAGGGLTSGNAESVGRDGGDAGVFNGGAAGAGGGGGGAGGAVDGVAGTNGADGDLLKSGEGGGGGGSQASGTGGAGGNGGAPGGGAGGGGGGTTLGGAGGVGGRGECRVFYS